MGLDPAPINEARGDRSGRVRPLREPWT